MKNRILILTKYNLKGASSRYRILQYIDFLNENNYLTAVSPFITDRMLERKYKKKKYNKFSIFLSLIIRVKAIVYDSRNYDVVFVQKELLPWAPLVIEKILLSLMKTPFICDFDDSEFLKYNNTNSVIKNILFEGKLQYLVSKSKKAIFGNTFLKEKMAFNKSDSFIIPTGIDVSMYSRKKENRKDTLIIGWIGSPSTQHYLKFLIPVFEKLEKEYQIEIRTIGANNLLEESSMINEIEWKIDTYIEELNKFDIGIMPLTDSQWEKGKCSFKLIQYMGCSIPVVASPVGMNNDVVENGENGFFASNLNEWYDALSILINNKEMRISMGEEGYKKAMRNYDLSVTGKTILEIINSAIIKNEKELEK